jgi:hypothetical protein
MAIINAHREQQREKEQFSPSSLQRFESAERFESIERFEGGSETATGPEDATQQALHSLLPSPPLPLSSSSSLTSSSRRALGRFDSIEGSFEMEGTQKLNNQN